MYTERQGKKKQKDDGGVDNKCAEVTGGQLHTMFTSSVDIPSGTDFIKMGEDDEFTWHQFHVKGWGAQEFEGHLPVAMHNTTGSSVTLIWFLLDSQLTVDLIVNVKMLVNIRNVWGKYAIRFHFNSWVKIVDRVR